MHVLVCNLSGINIFNLLPYFSILNENVGSTEWTAIPYCSTGCTAIRYCSTCQEAVDENVGTTNIHHLPPRRQGMNYIQHVTHYCNMLRGAATCCAALQHVRELVSVLEVRIEPGDLNPRPLTPQSVTIKSTTGWVPNLVPNIEGTEGHEINTRNLINRALCVIEYPNNKKANNSFKKIKSLYFGFDCTTRCMNIRET